LDVLISNAVSTETVKGILREAQLNQSDRKVRVIPTHCETRFGSRHLVLRAVLDPLFFVLEDGKWKLLYNSLSESERSDVDECVKRIGGEDAEKELFDLVVMNLPCNQLLNKLYASCAAQEGCRKMGRWPLLRWTSARMCGQFF
jgi:hypothetical protein